MTDYLPLPITDSPHNTQHPSKFIPKNFPTPLLEALNTLKARGIRVDLCSRTSVLDTRFNECNIICGHDQIILPDDIPETCECIYIYKKSDRWMVSHVDPIYEKFTPLIFAKKNRLNPDAMHVIDNGNATESELVYYNLRNDILNKLEEMNLMDRFSGWSSYGKSAKSCAHKLALAINSLDCRRICTAYYHMSYCMDQYANNYCGFIPKFAPELEEWIASTIIKVSITRNVRIRGYKKRRKNTYDRYERLCEMYENHFDH